MTDTLTIMNANGEAAVNITIESTDAEGAEYLATHIRDVIELEYGEDRVVRDDRS